MVLSENLRYALGLDWAIRVSFGLQPQTYIEHHLDSGRNPLGSFDPPAQPPNSLSWSMFTNPFTGALIAMPPSRPSVASGSTDGRVAETDADRFLAEIEEGLGSESGSTPGSFETNLEGWYDRFDPTSYTFPVLPQQSHQDSVAAGFATPPPVYTTTISLPDTEEEEDVELDAVVIVPRSPAFWWRCCASSLALPLALAQLSNDLGLPIPNHHPRTALPPCYCMHNPVDDAFGPTATAN